MSQIIPLAGLFYILWYVYRYPGRRGMESFIDLQVCLRAAKGDFTWHSKNPVNEGWIYPDYLAILWRPLAKMGERKAGILWLTLNLAAYCVVSHFLLEMDYGWLLVIAFTKVFAVFCWAGNIAPILVCISILSPVGAVVSSLFKPYYFAFVLWHVVKAYVGLSP